MKLSNLRFFLMKAITGKDFSLASASGILLTLSFPKFNLSLVSWIALIPLLFAIEGKSFRKAFLIGWFTGLLHFATLLHWVLVAMTQYGNISSVVSTFLLILLSLYLGLYLGFFCWAVAFFRSHYLKNALILAPMFWVILEYMRTYLFTGFPWGILGYSQYQNLLIIQISDITGVYGVSFLIVMVNTFLYLMLKCARNRNIYFPWKFGCITVGLLLVSLVYGNYQINNFQKSYCTNPLLKVGLIQGNLPQDKKWEPSYQQKTLHIYKNLTLAAAQNKCDLILWPESALPCYFVPEFHFKPFVFDLVNQIKTPIVFGSLSYEAPKSPQGVIKYFNSAFLAAPHKTEITRYDKMHLVPFGEYVPLKKFLPFVEKIVVGVGDFSQGNHYKLFEINENQFGVLICYEIIFPDISRKYRNNGAHFLVTITNDAWFGRTGAPYQHFAMAVFRAIENRIAVVRAANSGISGIITPTGKVPVDTPIFVQTFATGEISFNLPISFYSRFGDIGVILCGIIPIFVIIFELILKLRL